MEEAQESEVAEEESSSADSSQSAVGSVESILTEIEEKQEAAAIEEDPPAAAAEDSEAASRVKQKLESLTGTTPSSGGNTIQLTSAEERGGPEVSAATIGRMLGLATTNEMKLMEGKLDLLSTRVNNLTVRMEKVLSVLQHAPTGSDLERIDVHLGSLKLLLQELTEGVAVSNGTAPLDQDGVEKSISSATIVSNTE